MSNSNKTDEKNVLPKEHTEALMKRIKTLVSMFADEEQMNGKPIFYWNIMTNNDMLELVSDVPTSIEELSTFGIVGLIDREEYGERLIKNIKAYVEQEALQHYLDNHQGRKQKLLSTSENGLNKIPTTNGNGTTTSKFYYAGSGNNDPELKSQNNMHVSNHPVLRHKISILRSSSTNSNDFRLTLREITYYLGYEATSLLSIKNKQISVPLKNDHLDCMGNTLVERVALVPIMRSGLGMVESMLELLPNAGVYHIGMYKQNQTTVQYYNRLPRVCNADVAYVLDPLLASGNSMNSLVSILKKWGVPKIHIVTVIASKEGLSTITKNHNDINITVGEIDDELTEKGSILPGLGDSGDRLYGTPLIDDDEDLMHISKRKRSIDS